MKYLLGKKWALVTLTLVVPVGFYSKLYNGPAVDWVNNYFGGVLYVLFWCLVVYLLSPKPNIPVIATTVFVLTCVLEFLQLWNPALLELIRSNYLGRTILGSTFSLLDFVHYLAGYLLSVWTLQKIAAKDNPHSAV